MQDFKSFMTAEDGAMTVDLVVLTAGVVGICVAVLAVVSGGTEDLSGEIATTTAEVMADE